MMETFDLFRGYIVKGVENPDKKGGQKWVQNIKWLLV